MKKKPLRWKRQKRETGLAAIGAAERGWDLMRDGVLYVEVRPIVNGWSRKTEGWYWVAGWDSGIGYANTCDTPTATPAEAKAEALAYVKDYLAAYE